MYIDTDNYSASGIEVFEFPGGESHANIPRWTHTRAHVFAKLRTAQDVMRFLAVVDALQTQHVEVHAFMPYFPGARQDRNPEGKTPLTVRTYARMFAPLASVTVVDLHSNAAREIIVRHGVELHELEPHLILPSLIRHTPDFVLVPDAGAVLRGKQAALALGLKESQVLQCEKKREFGTGKLTGFKVPYPHSGRYLIADDICDGGGTFLGIAAAFDEIIAEWREDADERGDTFEEPEIVLDLFVTHGIFSQGMDKLNAAFDNIYTTNSYTDVTRNLANLTVFDLVPYYFGSLRP